MLIVSGTSRADNRRELARQASAPLVPVRLVVRRSQCGLASSFWCDQHIACRLSRSFARSVQPYRYHRPTHRSHRAAGEVVVHTETIK